MRAMKGTTLVEVLIALLIFSIGMLGCASMFIHSLRSSRSALFRTQAVTLASDMTDRIRANVGARAAYNLAAYGGGPAEQGCASTTVASTNCSATQLAQDDLARWLSAVRAALPGAPGPDVQYFTGDPQRYRVVVAWREPGEPEDFSYQAEILARGAP